MKKLLENTVYVLTVILMLPLILLNWFGGIIAAIMLLIGGDWTPIIFGVLFIFLGTLIISLLLIPMLIFSSIALFFFNRKNTIGFAFSVFVSQSYLYAIIFGISYSVFGTLLQFETEASKVALILWGFTLASAPWTYMASKEKDTQSTQTTLIITQLGLAIVVVFLLLGASLDTVFDLVRSLVIIPILFSTWLAIQLLKNRGDSLLTGNSDERIGDYSQKQVIIFVLALLETANADGKLEAKEIAKVRQVFKQLTDEGLSKSLVERIYFLMNNGDINLDGEIDTLNEELDVQYKAKVIKGCCAIARLDADIDSAERKVIHAIGHKLTLSKYIVDKIIDE